MPKVGLDRLGTAAVEPEREVGRRWGRGLLNCRVVRGGARLWPRGEGALECDADGCSDGVFEVVGLPGGDFVVRVSCDDVAIVCHLSILYAIPLF